MASKDPDTVPVDKPRPPRPSWVPEDRPYDKNLIEYIYVYDWAKSTEDERVVVDNEGWFDEGKYTIVIKIYKSPEQNGNVTDDDLDLWGISWEDFLN